jgi:hypothetical protein
MSEAVQASKDGPFVFGVSFTNMEKEVPFAEVVEELRVLTVADALEEVARRERERDAADQPYVDKAYAALIESYNKGLVDALDSKLLKFRISYYRKPSETIRVMDKVLAKFRTAIAVNKHTYQTEIKDQRIFIDITFRT